MENIYNELAEILEVNSVKKEDELSGFECWDSLRYATTSVRQMVSLEDEEESSHHIVEHLRQHPAKLKS